MADVKAGRMAAVVSDDFLCRWEWWHEEDVQQSRAVLLLSERDQKTRWFIMVDRVPPEKRDTSRKALHLN